MDMKESLGFQNGRSTIPLESDILPIIQLKLMATGFDTLSETEIDPITSHAADLIRKIQSKYRGAAQPFCPLDQRIQSWLDHHFGGMELPGWLRIPGRTLQMDFHGLARTLSLPKDGDLFVSEHLSSYRVTQGVLNNPTSDRRTTKGTFHVSEGGLPVPGDKCAVPKEVFGAMLWHAFNPPDPLLTLPYTSNLADPAKVFTSIYLRPLVSPEVPGQSPYKDMEIRFLAPGSLVSNLDFVESIFGNGGDPFLPENDAALDVDHFCGVTGCVVLAPHLTQLRKKDLGLPRWEDATPRQRRDGMCWKDSGEKYNNGTAFKLTFRTAEGLMITLIADNYYGYCKKEVKTQIGFAANLIGGAEEEHSGGALIFPSYYLGDFVLGASSFIQKKGYSFKQNVKLFADAMDIHPDGYATDKAFPDLVYLPEDAAISLNEQRISWKKDRRPVTLKMLPGKVYMYPTGYKVRLEKHPGANTYRLIGTVAEGTLCHKPCTVSGGGKSEISKSIADTVVYKAIYVSDFKKDFDLAEKIVFRDYGDRFRIAWKEKKPSRPLLDTQRSLGSVVRLLTPSSEYSDAYNAWVRKIPHHIRTLVFIIKRFYKQEWGEDIRSHFSVDFTDGKPGHELNYRHRRLLSAYVKVGMDPQGSWRVFRLRTDFVPATKLQTEDDITASIVLPGADGQPSFKYVQNCEYRLFQRPDDAIHRGQDTQAEKDLAGRFRFISNYEPLRPSVAREIQEHVIGYDKYSAPMRELIADAALQEDGYWVCTTHPRIVDGKPTANVRYLQDRPDMVDPFGPHVAHMGQRLNRKLSMKEPLAVPVDAILIGRRNNPAMRKEGIRALAVYNPLHFQELPEAFMDFVASLSGKSPSTTGAGSEGALTKGPFNALWSITDLNNALLSYILTDLKVFSTPAGYIGNQYKVDHDLSLLIPELWCRMTSKERDAKALIEAGLLEPVPDIKAGRKTVEASRLGYRINVRFLHAFMGRIVSDPLSVFPEDMIQPEKQDARDFLEGVEHICEAQKKAAETYLEDGSVEAACPPLKALLHIMVHGHYQGMKRSDEAFRSQFLREHVIKSDWYLDRLRRQQIRESLLLERHREALKDFLAKPFNREQARNLELQKRLARVEARLKMVGKPAFLQSLMGTLGADPLVPEQQAHVQPVLEKMA